MRAHVLSRVFWSKKCFSQKIDLSAKKEIAEKKLSEKLFVSKKMFGPKYFVSKNIVDPKSKSCQKKFRRAD